MGNLLFHKNLVLPLFQGADDTLSSAVKAIPSGIIINDGKINKSWIKEDEHAISTSWIKRVATKPSDGNIIPRLRCNGGTEFQEFLYWVNVYNDYQPIDLPDHVGINPRLHQLEIIDAMVDAVKPDGIKNIVINQARSAGKTESIALGISSVVMYMLQTKRSKFKIGYTALKYSTVADVADLVNDYLNLLGVRVDYNKQRFQISIKDHQCNITIWFQSVNSVLRGKHNDYLIMDEYAFYKDNHLKQIIPLVNNTADPVIVYCSTPNGDNLFKTMYEFASNGVGDSGEPYKLIEAKFSDLRSSDIQDRFREIMHPADYNQEMELSFNAIQGAFFPYSLYDDCFNEDYVTLHGKVWVGMDPARGADGRDYFGLCIMDERCRCLVYQFNGKDANVNNPAGYDLYEILKFAFKKIRPYLNRIQKIFIEDQNPTISDKIAPVLKDLGINNYSNGYCWFDKSNEFSIIKLSNWHGEGKRQDMVSLYRFLSDEYEVDSDGSIKMDEDGDPIVTRYSLSFNKLGKGYDDADILHYQFGHFIMNDNGTLGNDDNGPKDKRHDDIICALAHCVAAFKAGSRRVYEVSVC